MIGRRHVVLFVKAPVLGKVKTRLSRDLGTVTAARVYRQMTRLAISRLRRGPWTLWLAVDPVTAVTDGGFWPTDLPRLSQGTGDLGTRMERVFRALPPGPAVIVGSDCPGMGAGDVAAALDVLGSHRSVFGPAEDGGYWLVGLRSPIPRQAFGGVRWSTEHALADSLAAIGGSAAFVRRLPDVDKARDLRLYRSSAAAPFMCSVKRGINSTRLQGRKRLSS